MTVSQVMMYGKVYQWALSQAYHEIPSRVVSCGCGADIDQYCIFRGGRSGRIPHADRRGHAQQWKQKNESEYADLKDQLIAYYVGIAIQEISSNGETKQRSEPTPT